MSYGLSKLSADMRKSALTGMSAVADDEAQRNAYNLKLWDAAESEKRQNRSSMLSSALGFGVGLLGSGDGGFAPLGMIGDFFGMDLF